MKFTNPSGIKGDIVGTQGNSWNNYVVGHLCRLLTKQVIDGKEKMKPYVIISQFVTIVEREERTEKSASDAGMIGQLLRLPSQG